MESLAKALRASDLIRKIRRHVPQHRIVENVGNFGATRADLASSIDIVDISLYLKAAQTNRLASAPLTAERNADQHLTPKNRQQFSPTKSCLAPAQ